MAAIVLACGLTACSLPMPPSPAGPVSPSALETAAEVGTATVGTAGADTAGADTAVADTAVADTAGADTAVAEDTDAPGIEPRVAVRPPAADPSTLPAPMPAPIPAMRESAAAVVALCAELGDLLGSVSRAECDASRLRSSGGRSFLGRPLAFTDFPAASPDAPRLLVIGGIHGDEYSSVSLVFRWIERLQSEHAEDRHWRLVPVANPDGLLERRPATRTNARGVDLNRNFATASWPRQAQAQWIERTNRDPRRHPGPEPASEPETRWLQQLVMDFRPDVIVSLHAPHALLDFDATPEARLPAPERLGFLELQPLGTFPGSLGRYGSEEVGVPVLTLELPWAGIMPSEEDQQALWADLDVWVRSHPPSGREVSALRSR